MFKHIIIIVLATIIASISTFAIAIDVFHDIDTLLIPVAVIDVVLFLALTCVHQSIQHEANDSML